MITIVPHRQYLFLNKIEFFEFQSEVKVASCFHYNLIEVGI